MTAIEQKTILKEWEIKTIDDVALVLKGKGLSKDKISHNGKYKCILYGQLFTTYNEVIKEVKSRTDFEQGVRSQSGDVLMPGSTTTRAEDLAIASAVSEKNILLGGDINILRKKDDSYDSVFLAYYLTHYKKKEISSFGQGITIIHLYGRDIRKIQLILPPFSEQKKIAKILSTVDCEINKTDEIILQTEKLKKGLMQDLFTGRVSLSFRTSPRNEGEVRNRLNQSSDNKPCLRDSSYRRNDKGRDSSLRLGMTKKTKIGDMPKEWSLLTMRDICTVRQGLQIPISKRFKDPGENRYKYITLKNIKEDIYEYIESPKESVICKKDDVLMTRTGNTGVVVTNVEGVFHNNFFLIDFDRKKVDRSYLVYYLRSEPIKKLLLERAGTTTIPDLNHGAFYGIHFLLPSIAEQKKISDILSSVDDKIVNYKTYKNKLIQLKKSLMQDLLSGGVRVK